MAPQGFLCSRSRGECARATQPCTERDEIQCAPWIRYTDLVGFTYLLHFVPFDKTGRVRDALLQVCKVARGKRRNSKGSRRGYQEVISRLQIEVQALKDMFQFLLI